MKILEETNDKIVVKFEEDISRFWEKEYYEAWKKAEQKFGLEFNDKWLNENTLVLEKCELEKCKYCKRKGVKNIVYENGNIEKICILCLQDLANAVVNGVAELPVEDIIEIKENAKKFIQLLKEKNKKNGGGINE